jgi:hypothetical protein
MKRFAHCVRVINQARHIWPYRMKPEAEACHPGAINLRGCNSYVVPAFAQPQPYRKVRVQVAKRAESRQNKMCQGRPLVF